MILIGDSDLINTAIFHRQFESESGVLAELITHLEQTGKTQKDVAEQIGISTSFMNDIIMGRRHIPMAVATYLGYDYKVTIFVKKESTNGN